MDPDLILGDTYTMTEYESNMSDEEYTRYQSAGADVLVDAMNWIIKPVAVVTGAAFATVPTMIAGGAYGGYKLYSLAKEERFLRLNTQKILKILDDVRVIILKYKNQ